MLTRPTIERERFGHGSMPPWVISEHIHRYRFASKYVRGKTVLDCACGVGAGTKWFIEEGALAVFGLDASHEAALDAHSNGTRTVVGNAERLPFTSGSIDVFVSLETIEHLGDGAALVNEAGRVLKAGGLFICSTPNRLVSNPGLGSSKRPINPHHILEYSPEEFEGLLVRQFSSVELFGQSDQSSIVTNLFREMAKVVTSPVASRMRQACKLPRFLHDRDLLRSVRTRDRVRDYEYMIAVCTK
jgi:SAM-dependent methyltransferase